MKYTEIIGDLFSEENMNSDTYFAQCISADFGMGKGIAVEFNKRFDAKNKALSMFRGNIVNEWDKVGEKGICFQTDRVLNLVTKRNYWGKPTYKTLAQALVSMREICWDRDIEKVAMPQIGCGLDLLEWSKVSDIIRQVFANTNIEIIVCKLNGKAIAPDEKAAASIKETSQTLKSAGYKVTSYEDIKENPGRNVLEEVYKAISIIENILMDEFPELSKSRANEIANRIYDEERGN